MENRLSNLVWTAAEDYDFDIDLNFFSSNFNSKYKSLTLGYMYKIYNMNLVSEFLNRVARSKNNSKDLLFIAEITMENAISKNLLKSRPGIIDDKKEYEKNIIYKYTLHSPIDIQEELEKSYYEYINKIPVKINGSLYDLLKEILNFKSPDTSKLIEFLNYLYKKYFHIYSSLADDENIKTIIKKAKEYDDIPREKRIYQSSKSIEVANLEKFTIESAEFTSNLTDYDNLKVVTDKTKTSTGASKDLYDKVQKHYGKETLKENEIQKLENAICTGVHEGIHLYFTKGEYTHKDSLYYKNEAENSHEENLLAYEEDKLFYKRAIQNLEEIIKNSLLRNTDEYETYSNSGDLVPSKVWQSVKGINNKIFKKSFKDHQGNISVDIILDQSSSQKTRQSQVAIEGFIIAEALTNLNIKTRVVGFNNFYNFMIVREFRSYNDSQNKNLDIFKYNASGSNRDGLIIKLMSNLIKNNNEERKIIIMLSDGKPNDEINLGLVGAKNIDAQDYTEDTAILDSFNQVLVSRLNNINVLGVFMGDENDLDAEKKIFGQNFAYITDIKRFHHIVGIFFKSISDNFNY